MPSKGSHARTGARCCAAACLCARPGAGAVPAALPEASTSTTYLAHTQAGIAAYHAERYAEAALAFEAARSLQPSEPLPYRYLADLYWRQSKPDQAAHVVRALAEVMPDAYFLDRLGSGYEESGLLGLAMLLYREAARIDPAFPSARYNLGRLLLKQGHGEQGMAEVQEALRLYPEFAEAHEVLGLAYTEQGRLERGGGPSAAGAELASGAGDGAKPPGAALSGAGTVGRSDPDLSRPRDTPSRPC